MTRFVITNPRAWKRVVHGDRDALEALCTEWLPIVLQWCRRLGGPRVDAEQAANDVFVIVLRKVSTVDDPAAFPSWAFSVTRRVLAQHRRRVWGVRWDPEATIERTDPGVRPEEAATRAQTVHLVQEVIAEMPAELAEVLVLCEIEQRPDHEAAAVVGIPTGTVKSRLRRARRMFQAMAESRGLAPADWREEAG